MQEMVPELRNRLLCGARWDYQKDVIPYQTETDKITAPQWSELLNRFDDANIYQTWSYGSVRWGEENLSHLVLKRQGEAVAMAQLRIIRPRFGVAGIAYLRRGPLC